MSKYPKYLNKVALTKQKIADHEYTVLYDRQGKKYLRLETFELSTTPELDFDVVPTVSLGDVIVSNAIWGLPQHNPTKGVV